MPSQTLPGIKLLLASAALVALPSVAHAQLLDTDWSDMDDGAPAAEAPAKAKKGSSRRAEIRPYIEAQQVLLADLDDGGDVLTYSTIAVGVDMSVAERNAEMDAKESKDR